MDSTNNLFGDSYRDYQPSFSDYNRYVDVPQQTDALPDGQEVVRIGYVDEYKAFNHPQGSEFDGYFKGTCGLVSCEDVLRQFGVDSLTDAGNQEVPVNERNLIWYAVTHGLCHFGEQPGENGGTSCFNQIEILRRNGVPAHFEMANDAETLATNIEQGRGVILELNAGVLWDSAAAYDSGGPNHAVVCTGVARDPKTGSLLGAYINDSGRGYPSDSGRFVPIDTIEDAWIKAGGGMVVTDLVA